MTFGTFGRQGKAAIWVRTLACANYAVGKVAVSLAAEWAGQAAQLNTA